MLARFVPIVRTFTPIVAGVSHMHYRTFVIYNVIGGALWGSGVTVLGYFLGQIAFVKANIEFILIGIVVRLGGADRRRAAPGPDGGEAGHHPGGEGRGRAGDPGDPAALPQLGPA